MSDPTQKPEVAAPLPYGEDPSLKTLAIETTMVGIETEFRKEKKKVPSRAKLRQMAKERIESSIKNGPDDYLGTGAPTSTC